MSGAARRLSWQAPDAWEWRLQFLTAQPADSSTEMRSFAVWCAREAWLAARERARPGAGRRWRRLLALAEQVGLGAQGRASLEEAAVVWDPLRSERSDAVHFAVEAALAIARDDPARAAWFSAEYAAAAAGAAAAEEHVEDLARRGIWEMICHAEADAEKWGPLRSAEMSARFVHHAAVARRPRLRVVSGEGSKWDSYGAWIRESSAGLWSGEAAHCRAAWEAAERTARIAQAAKLRELRLLVGR